MVTKTFPMGVPIASCLGPARHLLGDGIQDGHPAFGICRDDGVADAAHRDKEARFVALAGHARGVLADQRFLELIGGSHAPAFGFVPLLQPPLEDGARIAQAIGEIAELSDTRRPRRDRLTARQRPRRSDGRHLGADDAPANENCHQQSLRPR